MPKHPDFETLRIALHRLTLEQARQLYAELGAILQSLEHPSPAPASGGSKSREIVDIKHMGDRLYQLERVRCGKASCKCVGEHGELHGPYWYAYWREEGRLNSRYVGKKL